MPTPILARTPAYRRPPIKVEPRTQRRLATVLFADVKSSMELSAAVELEDWWSVMCDMFDLMCECVYRLGGWVGNFTGDGMSAVFDQHDDGDEGHADRAGKAALLIRKALMGPAERLRGAHGLELSVRMGMHSGEILTGPIGGGHNRYYTASGFTVALAKRIEGLALAGRIYLSEYTATLLRPSLEVRERGAFSVKGAYIPVEVFELVGERRSRSALPPPTSW